MFLFMAMACNLIFYVLVFLSFLFFFRHIVSPFSGIILYRFRWQYQEDIFGESKHASIFIREFGV